MSYSQISNVRLGNTLVKIKNNNFIPYDPIIVSETTTLSVRDFIQCLENGLIINITNGNVIVNTPTANEILDAVDLNKYQQCLFTLKAFSATFPNLNTATFDGNTGVLFSENVPYILTTRQSTKVCLTFYDTSSKKIIIS